MQPDEAPYELLVYIWDDPATGRADIDDGLVQSALSDIHRRGDIDVVNLSFGAQWGADAAGLSGDLGHYKAKFQALTDRTLVVISAGNNGADSGQHSPSAIVLDPDVKNVMSIAAVAVANSDRSGERRDARARFARGRRKAPRGTRNCIAGVRYAQSNCGSAITLAAPGEDLLAPHQNGYEVFSGTSAAAPVLAGVAGLLQAARTTDVPRTPASIKDILVRTADDITERWDTPAPDGTPERMRRVNALAAVREILPSVRTQRMLISDDSPNAGEPGRVIAIEIDPATGLRRPGTPDGVIELARAFSIDGVQTLLTFTSPTAVAMSPSGDRAYVIASTTLGSGANAVRLDGLVIIDPLFLRVAGFVAFLTPDGIPIHAGTTRPGLAPSRDGRLLYVGTRDRLLIVDPIKGDLVWRLADLPAPYRTNAADFGEGTLLTRLVDLVTKANVETDRRGAEFGELALSPDGRVLYATVGAGSGGGFQPGVVLPIDVDLYRDADPSTATLESELALYLTPKYASFDAFKLSFGGTLDGGDEPSDVAVSPDGRRVYMTNGGTDGFFGVPAADVEAENSPYSLIATASIMGTPAAEGIVLQVLTDVIQLGREGMTQLVTPGLVGVFNTTPPEPSRFEAYKFPSQVTFGWQPPSGLVINQIRFPEVFAKRPKGLSISPRGDRALVSYFQTGNFGVLDLGAQRRFGRPDAQQTDAFSGVAGVTPALPLDVHLWPKRGAFDSPDGTRVPSPDESLLYPGPIEYAQNGNFAVAVHTGTKPPQTFFAEIPDFTTNHAARFALNDLGFSIAPGATSGTAPDGRTVSPFDLYPFARGGGAITILNDETIRADVEAHADDIVQGTNGQLRPYYTQNPVCRTPDASAPRCSENVYTQIFEYDAGEGEFQRFVRPRGVAISPFVAVERPFFGDVVHPGTRIQLRWWDPAVSGLMIEVFDLGADASATPRSIRSQNIPLTRIRLRTRTAAPLFKHLLPAAVDGHRYRLEIKVTAAGRPFTILSHEVRFTQ